MVSFADMKLCHSCCTRDGHDLYYTYTKIPANFDNLPQSVKKGLVVCLLSPMQSDVSMRSMNSSGRSRGGSTALSKGCLQKYYAQTYYTYTMATLELHGRARTCACQLKVISCIKNLTCAHHLCACICKQLY